MKKQSLSIARAAAASASQERRPVAQSVHGFDATYPAHVAVDVSDYNRATG